MVDESGERRGQASVNATYNNKVAVLADGDDWLETDCVEYLVGLMEKNDCEMATTVDVSLFSVEVSDSSVLSSVVVCSTT